MITFLRKLSVLVTLVLVGQIANGQSSAPVLRKAARVTLSSGQVVNVLSTFAQRQTGRVSTVLFMGDAGSAVVVTEEADAVWNQLNLSISDGGHRLVMRFHIGYVMDGLPGPAELQVDGKVFRWLSKEGGESTPQKRAMQKAVAELPEGLRRDVITFASLCAAAPGELVLPPSGFIVPELFAESLPRLSTHSIERLSPEEVSKIFQENAAGFLQKGATSGDSSPKGAAK